MLSKWRFSIVGIVWLTGALLAQQLPEGKWHRNRERSIDIVHYKAELTLDMAAARLSGEATIAFHPLEALDVFSLDAFNLNVQQVLLHRGEKPVELDFLPHSRSLAILLDRFYTPHDTLRLTIRYNCRPRDGMYFQPDPERPGEMFVHTYGEGGLHANWLPIYNDVNDKFSTEMIVTVPAGYAAISNGGLLEKHTATNGAATYHWSQTLPHANYLISVYAGRFEKGDLDPAFGTIPLSYWVPEGHLAEGAYAFRNTTRMVEFFSRRFDYEYPWDKYDQVAVPDYAIGAMEHTGVTGHRWSVLRDAAAPENFGPPLFRQYHDFWTADGTISHELAHHWFGNNLTCRNLSYIWLNESFASYLQILWDEEDLGRETLMLDRQVALDQYLDYVHSEHLIRPLEYHRFDMPDDIYNEAHTYLKGAIVLHMLRGIMGDEPFFRAMGYYLKKHQFANVESSDLLDAIAEATGQNLDWFFDDWVYGGGHPLFEISYTYLSARRQIDLQVTQVQPLVDGQDRFKLPVTVRIATAEGMTQHRIWLEEASESFFLASPGKPLMVSFDGSGDLVAEINFEKSLDELAYQALQDSLPGQIRALRQLAERFPVEAKTMEIFNKILNGTYFWGFQAEALVQLGNIRTPAAAQALTRALKSGDYRLRKAAVMTLPALGTEAALKPLSDIIGKDPHADVVATAIVALAQCAPEKAAGIIPRQLGRKAWYDEITIACLVALGDIGDVKNLPQIKPYVEAPHNQDVRQAALVAWKKCAPEDPELHRALQACAEASPYRVRQFAIAALGELYVEGARPLLEALLQESGDTNLQVLAERALEQITRVEKP